MAIKPICFMVMPFGKKPTNNADPKVPGEINFDLLWDRALRPLIEDLGYKPIRADQDVGSLIVQEMIERLAYSDLVIAEMTILNANVYYEVGVRQAAQREGCVLIAANWARQAFDVDQMRRVTYPLPEGEISEATAADIRAALLDEIGKRIAGISAVFQALRGYETKMDAGRAEAFKESAKQLAELQADTRTARRAPKEQRVEQAVKLAEQYKGSAAQLPSVALELLNLLKDTAQWQSLLAFVGGLSERVRDLPIVQETYALALSKSGQPQKAIEVLEVLIETNGETSERRGLLGGRYKALSDSATDEADKYRYLSAAIEQYEHGMQLDLNDYYPSSNLPRLYRRRGDDGDEAKAREVATVALAACHRARLHNPKDQWVRPTLLGAAFDTGDAAQAKQLYREIIREGPGSFQLNSTIPDLEKSLALQAGSETFNELQKVLDELKKLAN
ncbi:MAG: TRAFs-binding domain-containing protein [Acidobacteria bacterium]|nr:TRAFs-binding domain-containing protein [Acidobacteriota bacterium]